VTETDVDMVLDLNHRNVEALAPMDRDRMVELRGLADRFDVLETDGRFAGFVVTFGPGSTYDSENYAWFADRYGADFYYLDRIVLDQGVRRQGLGGFVYDEIERVAKRHHRLTLEVNLRPRNEGSLAFHARRGYTEVGRLGDETHLVSLQEKDL
jgi:predicted GNAT superfamily acetyltransferase